MNLFRSTMFFALIGCLASAATPRSPRSDFLSSRTQASTPTRNRRELRESCSDLLKELGGENKPALAAFGTILDVLESGTARDPDKVISRSLETIQTMYRTSYATVPLATLYRMFTCSTDRSDRPMIMRVVQLGLLDSVSVPVLMSFSGNLESLVDAEGNNLMHLAALSDSKYMVEKLVHIVEPSVALVLMDARNDHKQRPLDLALAPDLRRSLKDFYIVFSHRRDQMPQLHSGTGMSLRPSAASLGEWSQSATQKSLTPSSLRGKSLPTSVFQKPEPWLPAHEGKFGNVVYTGPPAKQLGSPTTSAWKGASVG